MLLSYRSVFFPRPIFNCETWSTLTKSEVASLQKAHLRYLRNMMKVANSTQVAGAFLHLGILSVQFEIDMRKSYFLWKIVQKENDDPVKQIYVQLKRYCFEKNWANEMMWLRPGMVFPYVMRRLSVQVRLNGVKKLSVPFIVLL